MYGINGAPLLFTARSHVAGKNAIVSVFPDRIEWSVGRSWLIPALVACCTCFFSLFFYRGIPQQTSVIPIRSISQITTKRDGALNTVVHVHSTGGSIGFRVSHEEARRMQAVLFEQMGVNTAG